MTCCCVRFVITGISLYRFTTSLNLSVSLTTSAWNFFNLIFHQGYPQLNHKFFRGKSSNFRGWYGAVQLLRVTDGGISTIYTHTLPFLHYFPKRSDISSEVSPITWSLITFPVIFTITSSCSFRNPF